MTNPSDEQNALLQAAIKNAVIESAQLTIAERDLLDAWLHLSYGSGHSEQYVSDLRRGMRRPTVEITTRLCEWLGRGPQGTREWHKAGARAHGWLV